MTTENKTEKKGWKPLVGVFIVVTLGVLNSKDWLTGKGFDCQVVLAGNALLFAVSMLVYFLYSSAMKSKKSYGFVQQVYTGFILKFFVLIGGAIVYFYFAEEVNKPAVFACMALYLVYNFLGTSQVVKKNDKKK
jgi:uncharacterized membrane protein